MPDGANRKHPEGACRTRTVGSCCKRSSSTCFKVPSPPASTIHAGSDISCQWVNGWVHNLDQSPRHRRTDMLLGCGSTRREPTWTRGQELSPAVLTTAPLCRPSCISDISLVLWPRFRSSPPPSPPSFFSSPSSFSTPSLFHTPQPKSCLPCLLVFLCFPGCHFQ